MPVSIIIPTLNESSCLGEAIHCLRRQKPREIIVVDGGSTDGTCEIAAKADHLILGPRGRAVQMNLGAKKASGDVLLFLHADCLLEQGALARAEACLQEKNVAAGCFTMRAQATGLLYRAIDFCASARVRLTGLVYGDQGLFLRRKMFHHAGGFPNLRFMEDLFFSRVLRKYGRIVVASKRILVSPRRWQRAGLLRQTLRNWTLTTLAAAGIHPDQLARFYPVK